MTTTASAGVVENTFEGIGGLRIFYRSWFPDGTPRGLVVICHGVNSHGGQYLWAGERFAAAGYAVHAIDLRGRGRSEGERFYVEDVAHYAGDLGTLIGLAKAGSPGLPVFLLGHSAGGVTSCIYVLDHQDQLAGFICESFAFQVYAPDVALALLKGLSHVAPHAHVLKLPFENFSRDPEVVRAMHDDPLIDGEVQPVQTVAALARADERIEREFERITLPVLILHGTADKTTKPGGSERFHQRAGSIDKTLKLYDGHFHDLLRDYGREEVMADILAWIDARLPNR